MDVINVAISAIRIVKHALLVYAHNAYQGSFLILTIITVSLFVEIKLL